MTTVSIIIPSYNCEAYIAETLASVLAQQGPELDVIVVDDGSTDRTRDIVRGFGSAVRLISQRNAGVCRARNHGIALAQGEFICLLDHDDYWFPGKLARQLQEMQRDPAVGVVFSTFLRWRSLAEGQPFPAPASFERDSVADDTVAEMSGWIYHQFLTDCFMLTSTAMFRREAFERCGSFDEALPYSEDWELWLRMARELKFVQLRRPSTLYRMHQWQEHRTQRPIDYRTRLLEQASREFGLASRDGRQVDQARFHHQLGRYHADYARGQLASGATGRALASFAKAWRHHPAHWKYPAYMVAALAGWRPRD